MKEGRRYSAALVAQLISTSGSLLLTLISARLLDAGGRGVLAYYLLFPNFFSYILGLGIPALLLQLQARAGSNDRASARLTGLACAHPLLFVLPVAMVVASIPEVGRMVWGPLEDDKFRALAMVSLTVGALFNNVTWLDYGRGAVAAPTAAKGLIPGLTAVGMLVGSTYYDASPYLASAGYASVLTLFTAIFLIKRVHACGCLWPRFRRQYLSLLFFLQLALLARLFASRFDQVLLGSLRSPEELGVYSVAAAAAESAAALPTVLSVIAYRRATRGQGSRNEMLASIMLAAAVACFVALIAPFVIPLLFGNGFAPSVQILWILLPGVLGTVTARIDLQTLQGTGRARMAAIVAGGTMGFALIAYPLTMLVSVHALAATVSGGQLLTAALARWAVRQSRVRSAK